MLFRQRVTPARVISLSGMKSVAIIGGGVAGLLGLRHSLKTRLLKPILYEATHEIGGIWAYDGDITEEIECNDNAAISVYENLVTNQSKEIMEFPDFHHENGTPTFLRHEMVLDYLKRYSTQSELQNWIKFEHKVLNVTPVARKTVDFTNVQWKVDVLNLEKNEMFSEIFDAVVICNGHFSKPKVPNVQGIENFRGKMIHSRSYRRPSQFTGDDVLLVGAGASGVDIALDVATAARKAFLSNRGESIRSEMPGNFFEVPEILHFSEDGLSVTFVNGQTLQVSSVIFCTGYFYDFPFLDRKCGISVNDNRVTHLFKHIINIKHTNMFFIGLPHRVPVFPILDIQAVYSAGVLSGKISLPSIEEMLADEASDFDARVKLGWPQYKAHIMTDRVFEYADYLANAANVDKISDNVKNLYNFLLDYRGKYVATYKNEDYILNGENEYVLKHCG